MRAMGARKLPSQILRHAPIVLSRCDRLKVVRIYARSVAAFMIKPKAIGDFATENQPDNAMSVSGAVNGSTGLAVSIGGWSTKPNPAAAIRLRHGSLPYPIDCVWRAFGFARKAIGKCRHAAISLGYAQAGREIVMVSPHAGHSPVRSHALQVSNEAR